MPSDLARLLQEASPQANRPLDADQIWTTGRRRRRRRQLTLGVVAIAVAGLTTSGAALLSWPDSDRLVIAAGDLVTYEDTVRDFSVEYPATWHRASPTLTPGLADPVEILSLGTYDLPVGGDSCAQFPAAALEAMSATDAFLTVQERRPSEASFPPRPDRFPPGGSKNVSEVVDCLAGPAVFDQWWFAFQDGGRSFHVLVAIGTQASERTRADPWRILDSLEFDPRQQVRVPALKGLTLDQAEEALQQADLGGGPTDGDPTQPGALVVAQKPAADTVVLAGDAVGLRTALVTPELCEVLLGLPDFSDGAHWDLPMDVLQDIADLADPALRRDTLLVSDHIMSGDNAPDNAATRALDRLVIHRRACG